MSPEYLAGFFDGEGCVNITIKGKSKQVALRCMLVNTDYEFLSEVQAIYGGRLTKRPNKKNPHWKPFCSIYWTDTAAINLLRTLQPFIRLKAAQVALALEFSDFMRLPKRERCIFIHSPMPGMPSRITVQRKPEVLDKELWFKDQMHVLNRKGVHAH